MSSHRPVAPKFALVVEGDVFIQMISVDTVKDERFMAIEVATTDQAGAIPEKRSDIGAIFTGMKMLSNMDALELASYMAEH